MGACLAFWSEMFEKIKEVVTAAESTKDLCSNAAKIILAGYFEKEQDTSPSNWALTR